MSASSRTEYFRFRTLNRQLSLAAVTRLQTRAESVIVASENVNCRCFGPIPRPYPHGRSSNPDSLVTDPFPSDCPIWKRSGMLLRIARSLPVLLPSQRVLITGERHRQAI